MQRKPTPQTRGPNAAEDRFRSWVKEQPCITCNNTGYVFVDHVMGATFRHNKVLIGHWFLLPLDGWCDRQKTGGKRKQFREKFGNYSDLWLKLIERYPRKDEIPKEVIEAIKDWGQ